MRIVEMVSNESVAQTQFSTNDWNGTVPLGMVENFHILGCGMYRF